MSRCVSIMSSKKLYLMLTLIITFLAISPLIGAGPAIDPDSGRISAIYSNTFNKIPKQKQIFHFRRNLFLTFIAIISIKPFYKINKFNIFFFIKINIQN